MQWEKEPDVTIKEYIKRNMQDKTDSVTTGTYKAYEVPVKEMYNFQTMLHVAFTGFYIRKSLQEMSLQELHKCSFYIW